MFLNCRVLFLFFFFISISATIFGACITLDTVYGSYDITEPVLIDLLQSPCVQRLKKINQYGVRSYLKKEPSYTRYEHSIGVLVLLRRFGASLQEQIAGLLHDVSHTVFSHVGDHVFAKKKDGSIVQSKGDAYQDSIHGWFLHNTEIETILFKYDIAIKDILHKNGSFSMLEQKLPNICADRLEYNLYGGYVEGILTQKDIADIIATIQFDKNQLVWFFTDQHTARKCAQASLYLTEHIFASLWGAVTYHWAARALLRAVDINLISLHDIHFSIDDVVWHALITSQDPEIKCSMHNMFLCDKQYTAGTLEQHDFCITAKFRGINPFIKYNGELRRLTNVDTLYAQEYCRVKQLVTSKRYVTYT